jgi:hypothetical protein
MIAESYARVGARATSSGELLTCWDDFLGSPDPADELRERLRRLAPAEQVGQDAGPVPGLLLGRRVIRRVGRVVQDEPGDRQPGRDRPQDQPAPEECP